MAGWFAGPDSKRGFLFLLPAARLLHNICPSGSPFEYPLAGKNLDLVHSNVVARGDIFKLDPPAGINPVDQRTNLGRWIANRRDIAAERLAD